MKKNSWDLFRDSSTFSYLNLARYYEYSKINQTPSTPTYPIMMNLLNLLEEFDLQNFKDTINLNCEILQQVVRVVTCRMSYVPALHFLLVIFLFRKASIIDATK